MFSQCIDWLLIHHSNKTKSTCPACSELVVEVEEVEEVEVVR